MKKNIIFSVLILSIFCGKKAISQTDSEHENCRHGHFHTNELGVSLAPVFFPKINETAFGLHSHYIRRFGSSKWGAGLGAELILNDHKHQTYSFVMQYNIVAGWNIVFAPGVAIEKPHVGESHEPIFALHLETLYEFSLGPIDIGPSFEFAYDKEDVHYSLGCHIGIPF